jgi:hypothetical protein
MTLTFPSNPVDNQLYPLNPPFGIPQFKYSADKKAWTRPQYLSAITGGVSGGSFSFIDASIITSGIISPNRLPSIFIFDTTEPTERPSGDDLRSGDIWVDESTGDVYYWYAELGVPQWVVMAGGGGGGSIVPTFPLNTVIVSATSPTTRPLGGDLIDGDLWFNEASGVVSVWESPSWSPLPGSGGGGATGPVSIVSDTSPTTRVGGDPLVAGDLWFNSTALTLSVRTPADIWAVVVAGGSGGAIDASQITTGTLDAARLPNLSASQITSGTFATALIPNLDAAKITTGIFNADRIPPIDISAAQITSGTINAARLPPPDLSGATFAASQVTSGTFDVARIPTLNIDAAQLTSGILDSARIPVISIDGGQIQTGTISAARIPAIDIDATQITSGIIDAARLPLMSSTPQLAVGYTQSVYEFLTSQTWTVPTSIPGPTSKPYTYMLVEAWGGGGGGARGLAGATATYAQGGGGGSYSAAVLIYQTTKAGPYTIIIGAGGAGGTSTTPTGGTGGNTTVNGVVLAVGGSGGARVTSNTAIVTQDLSGITPMYRSPFSTSQQAVAVETWEGRLIGTQQGGANVVGEPGQGQLDYIEKAGCGGGNGGFNTQGQYGGVPWVNGIPPSLSPYGQALAGYGGGGGGTRAEVNYLTGGDGGRFGGGGGGGATTTLMGDGGAGGAGLLRITFFVPN